MSETDGELNSSAPPGNGGVSPETGDPPPEVERLRSELAAAQGQAAARERELALRSAAEIENIRKRAARDVEQAHRFAVERLVQELLPVRDSLEVAAASGATADAATLAAGQAATLKLLARAFEKFAVQVIDPAGEPFDPQRHEAMATQSSVAAAPGTVLQVVQRGYELNGRLLRPARVIVASEPGG
ncbi:MAG TPA: nucleotide exchange factor GrpE [Steroidobacteraceae bacterium]|nr:nucleotide exchange factor GrpE [Steroidobacteraceae bacterium]